MQSDRAFFDSYDAVELVTPTGRTVRLRPLGIARSAYYLRHYKIVKETGNVASLLALLEEFPLEVGAVEELEELTPAELLEVVNEVFSRAPTRGRTQAAAETE